MLDLPNRISLSKKSKRTLKQFLKSNPILNSSSWGNLPRNVKNDISKKLLFNQRMRCVYCERQLLGLKHEIDHFANKGHYPQFSFNVLNLFYSCGYCNSTDQKGQKHTVSVLNAQYNLCTFLIVHPIFNRASVEISYSDPDRVFFDMARSTPLGNATIAFFSWHTNVVYSSIRSRVLIFERLNPLTKAEEMALIRAAVAYK